MAVNIRKHQTKPLKISFQPVDFYTVDWLSRFEDTNCMVEAARRYVANFVCEDCCNKCVPCREGSRKMEEILGRIVSGKGRQLDFERLQKIIFVLERAAQCSTGKTLAGSIKLSLEYFENEYLNHIERNVCSTIYVANKRLVIA